MSGCKIRFCLPLLPCCPPRITRPRGSPHYHSNSIPSHSIPRPESHQRANVESEISITFHRDINTSSSSSSNLFLTSHSSKTTTPPLLLLLLINHQKRKHKKHNTDRVPLHPGPATFSFPQPTLHTYYTRLSFTLSSSLPPPFFQDVCQA